MGVLADSWVELPPPELRLQLQAPRIVAPLVIQPDVPQVVTPDLPAADAPSVPSAKEAPLNKEALENREAPAARQADAKKPSPAAKVPDARPPQTGEEGARSSLSNRKPDAALPQKREAPVAQRTAKPQAPIVPPPSSGSAGSHRVLRVWLIAIWVLALACWGLVLTGLRF